MRAEELMIGDLVRVNKDVSIKKGTIVEIRAIDADREFHELKGCATCVPIDDPDGLSGGVWLDYLEPIPLNDEILQKNGFEYHEGERGLYGVVVSPYYAIEGSPYIFCDGHPFAVWFEDEVPIRYVHQLQHVLRLCGLDKEITIKE